MRRFAPPVPRSASSLVRLLSGIAIAVTLALTTISAQIPGRNINMVSGNTWPDGDPYLQRQNEPSIGSSTRNPLHLLAGANDYRTVDLPGLAEDETGDAWLGVFKSFDGGQRWQSTLLPGYLQDHSALGLASPIHGYGAAADPVVRAGTNGLMYYAGLVFDRPNAATPDLPGKSAIFVARYIDNNNKESGDTFAYLGTRALQTDPGGSTGNFLDKPWMVVDIPRDNTRCTIVTPGEKGPITQSVPAGPVYVAYTVRSTDSKGFRYDVMFTRSTDCGNTWATPLRLNVSTERANQGAALAVDPRNGNVYIAWRQFDVSGNNTGTDALVTVKYMPATNKLGVPGFARKFAKPKKGSGKGLNLEQFYKKGGVNKALEAVELSALDQSTSALAIRFRTNAYPSMAIDETGRVYLTWAERGFDPVYSDPTLGPARVLVATSLDGLTWGAARPVAIENQNGHQLMPSMTYAGGRLMLIYYDIRETRSQSFTQFIDDKSAFDNPAGTGLRHTIDLRASMASPGAIPAFEHSVKVSEYIEGPRGPGLPNVPLKVNPPNLPMFQKGTAPFIGDYVDIAAAPQFVIDQAGKWIYNTAATTTPPVFHAAWTDNRDVRVPLEDANHDGNPWNDYTPPGAPGAVPSIFDPSQVVPQCIPGNAGSRNQNVYTARITGGLLVGSPGNSKQLGQRLDENGTPLPTLIQRSFVVFAQNTSDLTKRFRFTINNQPAGGRASFDQFAAAPLTSVDADIPYRSTASRTVYATSTDPHALINVTVAELEFVNGQWQLKAAGLTGRIVLNPDIDNPDIDNPDIDNPGIENPDIDNVEVYNPDIDNPDIDNPDIDNPDIDNPDIDNPDIDNVHVANPDIDNPDIDNPDIDNPDIDNPDIDNPDIDNPDIDNASLMTDVTWSITNTGNTTASYNVNLFFAQQTFDAQIKTQLILYRTYKTPVVVNCELKSETTNVLVANIPDPHLVTPGGDVSDANDPEITNATIFLAPGESAKITLRIFDPHPDPTKVVTVVNPDGTTAKISAAFVPNEDVTPVVQQQSVNTEDVDAGVTEPPIVVQFPAPQTVPDSASTAVRTPVTFNVLANDSTAFGSTKVISYHPDGMAAHSGTTAGDVAYQPSTGYLYTARGAVDPVSNALVGRFPIPPSGFGPVQQQANPLTGINYARTNAANVGLLALDARPSSPTFHQYLPMPAQTDVVLAFAIDAVHGRLYAASGPSTSIATTPTTISVIDVNPASASFHTVLRTISLPLGVRAQTVAVNSRTQKVYIATTGAGTPNGGVYLIDGSNPLSTAVRINNTSSAWGVVINEAANLVFASTVVGNNGFGLYAIDGGTNSSTLISTAVPMRFGPSYQRLAVHEASGKVLMRLFNTVVVIDGQRGSPTRNTVVATINVGREFSFADIAIDQQLGLAVTVGNYDFQIDVIDLATNGLAGSFFPNQAPSEVAIDPIHHRAFVSVFSYVQEIELAPLASGSAIPVFVESGGLVINPISNKAYGGLFVTGGAVAKLSGSGFEGFIPGVNPASRYLFSERYAAANQYFITGHGFAIPQASDPGMLLLIEGATDTVSPITDLETNPFPFGIGIDQVSNEGYVATLSALTHGQLLHGDLSILDDPNNGAEAQGVGGPLPSGFPLNNPNSLLGFGRHVVVNPTNHKVYVMQLGASPTSVAVFEPSTNIIKPLDGQAGTPLFDAQTTAGESWGRVQVIRVHPALNRIYLGYVDQALNVTRVVAIDSATDTVVAKWVGGAHSFKHTASFIVVNEAANRLYVSNYNNDTVTMLDASTLAVLGSVNVADGPSAMAFNATANRLYVSSIDTKILTAIDGDTLQIRSTVRMPLLAYFLFVDEVESRVYTSGGDSADESGVMIITDILGQLGTDVSVTSVGNPLHGTAVLNADYSVTYTPTGSYSGPDQFTYTIAAPTGTAIGTVHVNVLPTTASAIAFSDAYNAITGQQLNVTAPGPLANDSTAGTTTMVVDDTTDHGILTPASDGSFTYQPNPGYSGLDSFAYHAVSDSLGSSNAVTVTITVTSPTSLVVINTADSGAGSLRQALSTANIESGSVISFAIPNAGPHLIQPQSALPTITAPTIIDGYTQPGSAANTAAVGTNAVIQIQIAGTSAGAFVSGLNVTGGGTTIRGLSITGFNSNGILLDVAGGNTVEGNFVGITPAGASAGNTQNGVFSESVNNQIGGASLASRNLVSGNTGAGIRVGPRSSGTTVLNDGTGTTIVNNLVGTDTTGLLARPNANSGIIVTVPNVTVGGTSAALRNVISGNTGSGINAFVQTVNTPQFALTIPSNLVVQGNYIGLKADGSGALANSLNGVFSSGPNTLIGGSIGTTPGGACTGACNVISGNGTFGINLGSSTDNTALVLHASASGSIIEGNFVGINPAGTAAMLNANSGIVANAANIRIGGTTPAQRNVVSGNTQTGVSLGTTAFSGSTIVAATGTGGIVTGNYIGVDTTGLIAVANNGSGVSVTVPNVRIGGPLPGERNIIAGNTSTGVTSNASTAGSSPNVTVLAVPSGMIVRNNYIGVAVDGTTARGNGGGGVAVNGANATIADNVISGNNTSNGIFIGAHFNNSNAVPAPADLGQVYTMGSNAVVTGNFIGTNAAGTAALPNNFGISVNAPGATIGGNTAALRNYVSGNVNHGISLGTQSVTTNNAVVSSGAGSVVKGNYVGVNAAGTLPVANGGAGIAVTVPNVTVGGPGPGDRNLVSGNVQTGVSSFASRPFNSSVVLSRPDNLIVEGNYVGTNEAGGAAISNSGGGVAISGANSIVRNNLISGNTGANSPSGLNISVQWENSLAGSLGTIYASPDGTQVIGNIIGLNAAGTAALANDTGVSLNGPNVTIGGSQPGQRNVIAGNTRNGIGLATSFVNATNTPVASAAGSVVRGNYIGLDASGTVKIVNGEGGINSSAANVTIGGPSAADGNFVANGLNLPAINLTRQTSGAVVFDSGSSLVQNNVIGMAPDLTTRLNSLAFGITVQTANNQILQNIFAGNGTNANSRSGIDLFSAFATGNIVKGNYIGTTPAGLIGLGNFGWGISINDASGNTIGGATAADRNVIVGNSDGAILIVTSSGGSANANVISGNYVGMLPNGTDNHNNGDGILLSAPPGGTISGTTIGGASAGARNVISGNSNTAISLNGAGVSSTVIAGNYIGVAADGVTARGNTGNGIFMNGAHDNLVGGNTPAEGNVIAFNQINGLNLSNAGTVRNRVLSNRIYANTFQAMDLIGNPGPTANDAGDGDAGPNDLQNYPVVSSAGNTPGPLTVVGANLSSFAAGNYTIQFFASVTCDASGFGEGERLVGHFINVASGGTSQFTLTETVPIGQFITATATDALGNTSEYSNCLAVVP